MGRRKQGRRSTVAIGLFLLGIWGLSLAPSLARAAACPPPCCPVEAEREDCGAGFAKQACCSTAPTPLVAATPSPVETPSVATLPLRTELVRTVRLLPRARFAPTKLVLRSSPLALSVVLLI